MPATSHSIDRSTLLTAAGNLFKRRGFAQTTLSEVAEQADISVDSLRELYPDTQVLAAAWLGFIHDASEARHRELLLRPDDAERLLREYFVDLKSYLESSGFLGCPYTALGQKSGHQCDVINKEVTKHKEFLLSFFREMSYRILGTKEEGRLLGETLFLLYAGATTESANLQSTEPAEQALRIFDHLVPQWKANHGALASA